MSLPTQLSPVCGLRMAEYTAVHATSIQQYEPVCKEDMNRHEIFEVRRGMYKYQRV
jgi:hypothetical protein